jgi:C1A family cysteine protease
MKSTYFLLALLFSYVVAQSIDTSLWTNFKREFQKSYSPEEESKRFLIFQENLRLAEKLNAADPHAEYGVTKFSDLTREEFKKNYLISNFTSPKKEGKPYPTLNFNSNISLPEEYDWRSRGVITPVYNQGSCGSCWAFSTTENIESMWAISGRGLRNLAMQQLVDCDHFGDHGCSGGNPPNAYRYIIATGGLDSYQSYPYVGVDEVCHFNSRDVEARIVNWGYITRVDNENEMGAWTYKYGPPSICVDAQYWQYYRGGVITTNCGFEIDHCVQLTGWSTFDGLPAWNVRNSWGTNWGYSGYLFVMRGANVCLIGDEVTSSVI